MILFINTLHCPFLEQLRKINQPGTQTHDHYENDDHFATALQILPKIPFMSAKQTRILLQRFCSKISDRK